MTDVVLSLAPTRAIDLELVGADGTLSIGTDNVSLQLLLDPIFKGLKGDSGPSGSIGLEIEQIAVDGVNTIVAPVPFVPSATQVYINGLRQSKSSYSISAQVVTLPTTLLCVAGDVLTFEYLPS